MSLFSRVSNTPSAINTSAANNFGQGSGAATGGLVGTTASSLFGQSTNQAPASAGGLGQGAAAAPAGGLFGSTATTSAPSGGLFGATATATTSAPAAAGGLFGGTTTTAAPAASGLFGSTPAPASTTTGGLFGASTATPASGSGGTGLFGATTTTSAPAATSLFGSTAAQPAASTTGGGLFGAPAATPAQPAQPAAGGGLFGSSTAAGPAGGLFGGQQAQRPAQTGLFGAQPAAQTTAGGLFNSSTAQQPQSSMFGQPQAQQQQPQAVDMNFSNMRGTTRYEELNGDVRSLLDYLDGYIQKSIGISNEISARSVDHKEAMESVDRDVEHVSRKLGFTTTFLNNDGHSIGQLHNASSQLVNTASLSTRTIDILRIPISQRSHYLSSHHTSNPEYSLIPYFEEKTGELEGKTENFLSAIGEVEKTLEAVERDVGQVNLSAESKVKEVIKAERMVFSGMLAVASKVASVNEDLKTLAR
ncbi:Nucleoporin nup49/NSP49 (Nuclear pore protein nup49/NSP49) [Orbilia brochopaga]|uniref:Nucleoporin nup49/NSP49 (Nuclear pore protein nup49/NSP49) n=1 Tax=Orbilia brochopaga TaxID=3140254 RepID=A0AAV9TZ61_9PEZI